MFMFIEKESADLDSIMEGNALHALQFLAKP
jgi:hypothetical protein